MNLFKKSLLVTLFLVCFLFLMSLVNAIDISSCGILSTGGVTYYLTTDIIDNATSPCIEVNVDNVIVDCNGYQIDGDGLADYGIYISNQENVTIQNCVFGDWDITAIDNIGDYNIFKDSNFTNSVGSEIYTDSDSFLTFSNLRFIDSYGYGINLNYFDGDGGISYNNTVENCYFYRSGSIIAMRPFYNKWRYNTFDTSGAVSLRDYTLRNEIYGNVFKNMSLTTGLIWFGSGSSDMINETLTYNNLFNLTTNATHSYFQMWGYVSSLITNKFNITRQYGTRIFGDGVEIGGNWWTNPNGDGYSDTCIDNDQNGFCDYSYLPQTYVEDFLPLSSNWTSYQTCVDSDGYDLNIKGFVRVTVVGTGEFVDHYDECATETRVYENWCDGTIHYETNTPCLSGNICYDGRCVSIAELTSCYDSDNGINLFVKGYVTLNVSGIIVKHYDECFSNERIFEQYCENASIWHEQNTLCPNSTYCYDGLCLSGEIDIQEDFVGRASNLANTMGFFSAGSKILLVIMIMIAVSIVINKDNKNIPLSIIAMFLIMVGATYLGWFPIWLLILVFFVGALASYLFVSRLLSGD